MKVEGNIEALEEERLEGKKLLAECEERILQLERKNRRLELALAKRSIAPESNDQVARIPSPAAKDAHPQTPQADQVDKSSFVRMQKEIEGLNYLAKQRSDELEKAESERANLRYQNVLLQEKLRRVPEEIQSDPRRLHILLDELQSLRNELLRQRRVWRVWRRITRALGTNS